MKKVDAASLKAWVATVMPHAFTHWPDNIAEMFLEYEFNEIRAGRKGAPEFKRYLVNLDRVLSPAAATVAGRIKYRRCWLSLDSVVGELGHGRPVPTRRG